ncbi:hypothetical protein FRB94_005393 [Tulasnella sp. JGI-2019a]|nr:hypothetical protein FRB94_005393 [Tulasnella sp. JGI-2019a]KAG9007572.1 hypothetical protein FRB93_007608 [Tulasnella sp. JGI-2019a]KAG9038056.1 hypothetical protein FRB95_002984 [Tulasnella sp. JGI-2019a]
MSYESQEQLRHDWINLQRIVKHLEGAVLNRDFLSHNADRQAAWLAANKTQSTVKHAKGLLEKVKDSQPSSSCYDIQATLDRMQKTFEDAKNDLYVPPPRPRSFLISKGLPRPAVHAVNIKPEPTRNIPEAELLPSEALMSPIERLRDDPISAYTPVPQPIEVPQYNNSSAVKAGTTPDRPASLTTSLDTQEELAEQLAQMGHQLKLNALHLANSLAREKGIIEGASEKLENNLGNMTKERVRLRDHSSKSGWTTWIWLGVILCVIFAWIAMFFIIRIT